MEKAKNEIIKNLSEFVAFIKSASPDVWQVLTRQHIIWGIISAIANVLPLPLLFYGMHLLALRPKWALDYHGDNWGGAIFFILGIVGLLATFSIFLLEGLPRLLNPKYYAIKDLKP